MIHLTASFQRQQEQDTILFHGTQAKMAQEQPFYLQRLLKPYLTTPSMQFGQRTNIMSHSMQMEEIHHLQLQKV